MSQTLRQRLGITPLAVLALAALGAPRVIAHDLGPPGPVVNSLLVFVPLAVWVAFVLWRRVPSPFLTLSVVGVVYGAVLALVHQVLWNVAMDTAPELGGALAGTLPAWAEALVLRGFAVGSSLVTGLLVGVATGAVAWILARMVPGFRHPGRTESGE